MAKKSKSSGAKSAYRLQEAMSDFIREKRISGKSPHTLDEYANTKKKLEAYFPDDPFISDLSRERWLSFFEWLRFDYSYRSGSKKHGEHKTLSAKSVVNVHTNISSFYTWMTENQMVEYNIIRTIEITRPADPLVDPLLVDEIKLLLSVCNKTATYGDKAQSFERPTAKRDRAMILLLFDTGIRASELCGARFKYLNLAKRTLVVLGKGPGGETKQRLVPLGRRAAAALNAYLRGRMPLEDIDFIFVSETPDGPKPMTRGALLKLLVRLGKKCGVDKVHPHRFRHSFGIEFLRNGGDVFALQEILGHTTLDMVRVYLKIAEADIRKAHKGSSPADNM